MAFGRSGLPMLVNAAPDGSDDLVGISGSGEGRRPGIVFDDEAIDSGLQVDNRDEDAAPQSPFGEFRRLRRELQPSALSREHPQSDPG